MQDSESYSEVLVEAGRNMVSAVAICRVLGGVEYEVGERNMLF
jgi:hypothetical protein